MIPFAVTIEGVTEKGKAHWVLAVTKDELLTVNESGAFVWYPLAQCKFERLVPPDTPKPVLLVPPSAANGIALPNRQLRRHPPAGSLEDPRR